jgi:hypothetical protein
VQRRDLGGVDERDRAGEGPEQLLVAHLDRARAEERPDVPPPRALELKAGGVPQNPLEDGCCQCTLLLRNLCCATPLRRNSFAL